jgi:hypothetical protein
MPHEGWFLLFSALANVGGIAVMRWMVGRTRPLVAQFMKLRDEKIEQNRKLIESNETLIQTGVQLISAQTQLRDALRQVEHYKHEADFFKQLREAAVRVADSKLRTVVVHVPGLDDQTKNLVRLAVDNPSANEGAAAALIVCKRLKEQI